MATHNTASDAANTAVRAFLTKVGEYYLKRGFNTGTGQGEKDWKRICNEVFEGKCAYCGRQNVKLQMDHLIMFNTSQAGLHHPGNIVPVCKSCNNRQKNDDKSYMNWEEQLEIICKKKGQMNKIKERKSNILYHIRSEKYPNLTIEEKHAIRVVAETLYTDIKNGVEKSLDLYKKLDESFVTKKNK